MVNTNAGPPIWANRCARVSLSTSSRRPFWISYQSTWPSYRYYHTLLHRHKMRNTNRSSPRIVVLIPSRQGTAVNLTCRDENHLARRTATKYIWLKNGRPLHSSCDEIIEDLTPVGSLLKIPSIQVKKTGDFCWLYSDR